MSLIITNAKIVTPRGREAVKGAAMATLKVIDGGCVRVDDSGVIDYVGTKPADPAPTDHVIDAAGRALLPGFVDSHTHMVFGGYRPDEFKMRLEGRSYMDIMRAGGGIQSTVNATREASREELLAKCRKLIDRMSAMGVTTVEVKSGYGLDTASEEMMLDIIARIGDDKVTVVPTFMGAHAVPPGYTAESYVDLIINEMLPRFRSKAANCDVFCEKDVFELEDSRRLLAAAKALGYKIKLHADEIVTQLGAELAAELGALSADHLLHVSRAGIEAMAREGVVATLLPLTAFALKEPFAPARDMIDGGCAVALATDLNPGSCFSGSIPLTIALACVYMKMSIEEVITALTLNGAAALGMADTIGSIEPGKRGDMVILNHDNINMLPYYVGMNCVATTIHGGVEVEK